MVLQSPRKLAGSSPTLQQLPLAAAHGPGSSSFLYRPGWYTQPEVSPVGCGTAAAPRAVLWRSNPPRACLPLLLEEKPDLMLRPPRIVREVSAKRANLRLWTSHPAAHRFQWQQPFKFLMELGIDSRCGSFASRRRPPCFPQVRDRYVSSRQTRAPKPRSAKNRFLEVPDVAGKRVGVKGILLYTFPRACAKQ